MHYITSQVGVVKILFAPIPWQIRLSICPPISLSGTLSVIVSSQLNTEHGDNSCVLAFCSTLRKAAWWSGTLKYFIWELSPITVACVENIGDLAYTLCCVLSRPISEFVFLSSVDSDVLERGLPVRYHCFYSCCEEFLKWRILLYVVWSFDRNDGVRMVEYIKGSSLMLTYMLRLI